jgi:adenosylcobinamide-GDP ribazoletransferase
MFTIVRVDVEGEEVMELSKRFYIVVLVGLFLGLIGGTMMYFLTEVFSPLVCAIIVIFVLMGLNRFLHMDGVSDMGDGLMVLGDHERKLAVMKDSHIGAGGMAYAMLFVLLSVASLAGVGHDFYFLAPFTAEILIKVSMVCCAASGEAREGLGGIFVRNTNGMTVFIAIVLAVIFLVPAYVFMGPDSLSTRDLIAIVATAFITTVITGYIVAKVAMKNFGCVNGDILGATNEITRPMVYLAIVGALWWMAQLHW